MTFSSSPSRSAGITLLAIGLVSGAVHAQRPLSAAPASLLAPAAAPLIPIHTAAPWEGLEYGVWAAGPTYKASFHEGATFIPYLGEDYPHNQPFTWHTSSVRIGAQELVIREPQLSYDGFRARYDLGAVAEVYDVQAGGLEQTFVIQDRPHARGDLVVRGVATTMLHATNTEARHGELQFRDHNGACLITYGAATAIDASGRRRAMTTAFSDGEITLRLDAAWLEEATFPVVVDPLLGPGDQLVGNLRQHIDIAHDPISSFKSYWISYTAVASLLDTDVFCHRFNQDGTAADAVFADATSSWQSKSTSTAFVPSANKALIVYERSTSTSTGTFNIRRIAMHATSRNTQTLQTNVDTVPTGGFPRHPDIGGTDNTNGGSQAMIVWQQDSAYAGTGASAIQGMLYHAGNDTYGSVINIANTVLTDNERPSINRYQRFTPATWRVAFQSITLPVIGMVNDDWDIGVVKVADDGSASQITWVDSGSPYHKYAPQIAGSNSDYMVAYVTQPQVAGSFPTGTEGENVRNRRILWGRNEPSGQMPYTPSSWYGGVGPGPVELGGLAVDRNTLQHWAMHVKDVGGTWSYINRLGFQGNVIGQDTLMTANSPRLGGLSFNHADNEFGIAYAINSGLFNGYLTMDRLARPATTLPVASGTSCSTASIEWTGTTLIGDGRCQVRINNAPTGALHTLALSFAPANVSLGTLPLFQSGCNLLIDTNAPNFFGLFPVALGSGVSFDFPLLEWFPNGIALSFQGFHTDGSGNLVFQSTQRLDVTISK